MNRHLDRYSGIWKRQIYILASQFIDLVYSSGVSVILEYSKRYFQPSYRYAKALSAQPCYVIIVLLQLLLLCVQSLFWSSYTAAGSPSGRGLLTAKQLQTNSKVMSVFSQFGRLLRVANHPRRCALTAVR